MSFSGFYQFICEKGHKGFGDVYDYSDGFDLWVCHCGAKLAWYNLVDTTNGSFCDCLAGHAAEHNSKLKGCEYCYYGRIDGWVELETDKEEITEICKYCGQTKVIPATFKIPKNVGHRIGEKNES